MNLVIDLGNTRAKLAVFNGSDIEHFEVVETLRLDKIKEVLNKYSIKNSILSSVIHHSTKIEEYLKKETDFIEFTSKTKLPIVNKYNTPGTLGKDRLANAIAAASTIPHRNVLVIDAGTCIKFDFVDANANYLGGHIAPGLQMRFNALHDYTAKLPLYKVEKAYNKLIGNTTEESLKTGVLTATIAEVEGMIARYKKKYNNLKIIVTGGDTSYFEQNLKLSIFADENLLLKGLNYIITNA